MDDQGPEMKMNDVGGVALMKEDGRRGKNRY